MNLEGNKFTNERNYLGPENLEQLRIELNETYEWLIKTTPLEELKKRFYKKFGDEVESAVTNVVREVALVMELSQGERNDEHNIDINWKKTYLESVVSMNSFNYETFRRLAQKNSKIILYRQSKEDFLKEHPEIPDHKVVDFS